MTKPPRGIRPCAEEGCERPAVCRSYCRAHYRRHTLAGDLPTSPNPSPRRLGSARPIRITDGTSGSSFPCPSCGHLSTAVIDSRPYGDATTRRRRMCPSCDFRFSTFEAVIDHPLHALARSAPTIRNLLTKLLTALPPPEQET